MNYTLISCQKIFEDGVFQHDNDPKHIVAIVKNCLRIEQLKWPPFSPDMNRIEYLWVGCYRKKK